MNLEKALKVAEEGCDEGHSSCGECVGSCLEGCESEASEIVAKAYRDSQTKLAESKKTLVEIEKRMEAAILEGDQRALEWGEHARESQKAARVLEAKLAESDKEVRRLEINCVENHGHLVLDVAAAEKRAKLWKKSAKERRRWLDGEIDAYKKLMVESDLFQEQRNAAEEGAEKAEKERDTAYAWNDKALDRAQTAEQSLREANRRGTAQDKRVEKMLKALENRCPCWGGEPGNPNGHSRDNCHQKDALDFCRQSDEEILKREGRA